MQGHQIGYIRVSTVEQNTVRQLDGIQLDRIFTDKCSGKDTNRPQLQEMLQFIRDGDTVYVHSMDRLARNLDDLRKLVNQITNKNVTIQFIKENLTFTSNNKNPISKLMLSVMGAFAEFERSLIKERQLEGIAIAKKEGKYKGRHKTLNETQVIELNQMVADRYKKVDIAKKFGISRYSVYRYLKSRLAVLHENITTSCKLDNNVKIIKLIFEYYVENNNKFLRGKKKVKENIELFIRSHFELEKIDDCKYMITVEYYDDNELDKTIENIGGEMHALADLNNCFIDNIWFETLDKKRNWDL